MLVQKFARRVQAWQLGAGSEAEQQMILQGRLVPLAGGGYAMFSQEAGAQGQQVAKGDYFKIDSAGFPYPNERSWFLSCHTHLEGDWYLQEAPVLRAWAVTEPPCPEICFLLETGRLQIAEADPDRYFRAQLWGAPLHAAKDAVIVFDSPRYRPDGSLEDLNFRFVAAEEFAKTYRVIE